MLMGSNGSTKTAACSGWEEPLGGTRRSGWLSRDRCAQALWFLVSGFCSESEVGGAPRCHALLWLTGGRPAMRSSPPGCRDPERKRRGSQHGCLGASDADRRGRCLSCPSPERLSCERQALCECFEYLSPSIECLDLLCWRQKEALSQRRRSGQCARRS